MQDDLLDTYAHKTVERHRRGVDLRFLTSQSLFSSNTVDPGTNLLLRAIGKHLEQPVEHCLDVGCGYGAIGLSLSASNLTRNVEMVDRDALAVDFARRNATANGIDSAEAHTSLGLSDALRGRYDLIVSNLPGKVGIEILGHLLASSAGRLMTGGQFWGVAVSPLWRDIEKMLAELLVETFHVEHAPRHTVFGIKCDSPRHLELPEDLLADVYARGEVGFVVSGRTYAVGTSRGVSEFDGLSYSTQLVLEQLYGMRNRRLPCAVVFNVGQGYVPLALKAAAAAGTLQLVDRDLLALRTTERNLRSNRLSEPAPGLHNQVGWLPGGAANYGLIVGTLRGDEPRQAVEIGVISVIDRLEPGGVGIIAGGSTPITRLQKLVQSSKEVQVTDRSRNRGASVISFQKQR